MNGGRRWPRYLAAGFLLYVLFLITTVPAAWVGELLARTSQGQARLLAARGTIWQGAGTLVVNRGGMALQNRVRWTVQPAWLVLGRLRGDVRSEGDVTLQATVAVGPGWLQLQDLRAELAASHAQALYPPAMLVSPTGQVKVIADRFELGSRGVDGEFRLTWTGAGSKLGAAGELGDYLLVANGQNGAAALRVETLRGDFRIDARGTWQAGTDGMLTLDGTLSPGGREAMVGPLLAAMNLRKEGDRYPLRFATRIPLPPALGGPP